jgi:hypothetical protein
MIRRIILLKLIYLEIKKKVRKTTGQYAGSQRK